MDVVCGCCGSQERPELVLLTSIACGHHLCRSCLETLFEAQLTSECRICCAEIRQADFHKRSDEDKLVRHPPPGSGQPGGQVGGEIRARRALAKTCRGPPGRRASQGAGSILSGRTLTRKAARRRTRTTARRLKRSVADRARCGCHRAAS